MSYKAMIQLDHLPSYFTNNQSFATREEAEFAAITQYKERLIATNWRVDESDEPVNYRVVIERVEGAV